MNIDQTIVMHLQGLRKGGLAWLAPQEGKMEEDFRLACMEGGVKLSSVRRKVGILKGTQVFLSSQSIQSKHEI